MGLIMEHDRPDGRASPAEGYEAVPLPVTGAMGDADGSGVAVLRRRTARPSKRAVVYVHCLGDAFVPADLVGWYNDRGFTSTRPTCGRWAAAGRGHRRGTGQRGSWASASPAWTPPSLTCARPMPSRPWWCPRTRPGLSSPRCGVTPGGAAGPWTPSSWPAPSWAPGGCGRAGRGPRRWRRGGGGRPFVAAAVGSAAQAAARARNRLPGPGHVPGRPGHGPGGAGGLLPLGVLGALGALGTLAGRRATVRLGEHVTWLTLDGGLPGQAPAPAPQRRRFLDEIGRWLGAYLSAQIRDQLL